MYLTLSVYYTCVGIELKKPGAEPKVFVPAEEVPTAYTVEQLQFLLGLALVLGFVFMLFVDQCGGGHSHNHSGASGKEWQVVLPAPTLIISTQVYTDIQLFDSLMPRLPPHTHNFILKFSSYILSILFSPLLSFLSYFPPSPALTNILTSSYSHSPLPPILCSHLPLPHTQTQKY